MRTFTRMLLVAALLVVPVSSLQRADCRRSVRPLGRNDPDAPNMAIKVEVDLAKNSKGELAGTFGQPAQQVKGLPLSTVAVEGRSVRFVVKGGPEPATFQGTLSPDGKSISGDAAQGGHTVPFTLTRTGDAQDCAAPKSAPIGKELEGTWNGTLDVNGAQMRLVLKMANQPDGTAAGTIVSLDGSGVEIPIAITQKGFERDHRRAVGRRLVRRRPAAERRWRARGPAGGRPAADAPSRQTVTRSAALQSCQHRRRRRPCLPAKRSSRICCEA